jgi:tetratricopeptide (TPR) repeat protein
LTSNLARPFVFFMSSSSQLLQNAVALHQAGRMAEAEQAYRKLLRKDPLNVDGLRLLGGLYLQNKDMTQAAELLEKAVKLLPDHAETLTNLGIALHKGGRKAEALAVYQRALEVKPDYIAALNNLGSLHHETDRTPNAQVLYARVLQLQPENAAAHFNYANSLLTLGKISEAITRYEHALQLKPDYIEAMINLGMAFSYAGKGDQGNQWLHAAQGWFEKALASNPNNPAALNNMGNILRQQGKTDEALAAFRKALDLRPDYVEASINLSTVLRDLGRLEEALASCELALKHKPDSAGARINLGATLQDMSRHAEAVDMFTQSLELRPSSVDAKWNKALSLLALGRYAEGWALHEIGIGILHMRGENPSPERRWQGEDITGKNLLLWCEQGFGDTLQFIRYAELCKQRGARIILSCPPALRPLLKNCPFIDELPDSITEKSFDVHAPLMSLPYIFGTLVETIPAKIPYLFVSDATRNRWEDKVPQTPGLKVGLVWAGNPRENQINAHMADRRRSVTLDALQPLLAVPGVQFYNLQMGAAAAQMDALGARDRFIDLMGDVKNFEDTGAIVEKLDLVISVDTSVVHLAGGMGKPIWVLSRYDACWRWLQNHADSPWYPTARIFGQEKPGDWSGVIERVTAALKEKIR